jgi:DNA mismatch repair protein MutS2
VIRPNEPAYVPDLLHPDAALRIEQESTMLSLVLAFAGATSGGLFQETLQRSRLVPSTYDPQAFGADLFLKSFVTDCFRANVRGTQPVLTTDYLLRLLANPPSDTAVIAFRRDIIWELEQVPALRAQFEELYVRLSRFRATIEGTSGHDRGESTRRQLSILEHFKGLIDAMSSGFANASSGLSRLAEFGMRIQQGEGYRSVADLLAYDDKLASVRFNVSIGADGRVRHLELEEVREAEQNVFVNPPWRRWAAKLELFLRGFRFGDSEVMARLLDAVFEGVKEEFLPLVQLFGDVEFYLAGLGFNERARTAGLEVCLPEIVGPEQPRSLKGLFNPLLLLQQRPVPCDLELDRHDATVLITGPNSGGKTRLLQTIGLTQLLAQVGLFVPAREARLSLCPALVVSLIQETRVDQSEGRLGMELVRIRALFESLPPGAMVILDELCSGTNPSEGEEIFELVIGMLSRLSPQAFITTHFLDFAGRLERARKIESLRFLQVVLGERQQPTYQFAPGVARTSLAAQAAARLGVTGDQLLALVERNLAVHAARRA